jgi:hypothetical protein
MSDDPDFEYLIVDSTIVRAHQHAAGAKKRGSEDQANGRSRGGLSTRIDMAVRGLGCPVRFTLTAGQKGDRRDRARGPDEDRKTALTVLQHSLNLFYRPFLAYRQNPNSAVVAGTDEGVRADLIIDVDEL